MRTIIEWEKVQTGKEPLNHCHIVICARNEKHEKTLIFRKHQRDKMRWPPFLRDRKATHWAYIDETRLP